MNENILVAYYSWSGNTERLAGIIGQETGGKLFKIAPVTPYPERYGACTTQAKQEIQKGILPDLAAFPDNMDDYNVVFIGSPNWWSTMAPPVSAFLSHVDLAGRKVVPFLTHGGGGTGHFIRDVAKICPDSTILDGFVLYGSGGNDAAEEISAWLGRIGIK